MRSPFALNPKRFARDEEGAITVEFVIWLPVIFFILMLVTDASLAFFSRAQAFRVIESGNRFFAANRPGFQTEDQTEAWIADEFLDLSDDADVDTDADEITGIVSTELIYPASDVVLFNTLGVLSGWEITVRAQQYVDRAL